MTSIEFAEKVLGIKLTEFQKDLLKKLDDTPEDKLVVLYPPHNGRTYFKQLSNAVNSIYGGHTLYGAQLGNPIKVKEAEINHDETSHTKTT